MRLSSMISCTAFRLCRTVSSKCSRDKRIEQLAERFSDKHHALFLGRGDQYPIAMEGALKLKEISYIHAEAYAAGELKHGPLALIDAEMPVIVVAPNNELLEKLKSTSKRFVPAAVNYTSSPTVKPASTVAITCTSLRCRMWKRPSPLSSIRFRCSCWLITSR